MKTWWELTLPFYIVVVFPMILIRVVQLLLNKPTLYTIPEKKVTLWIYRWADKLGLNDTV